jgi:hypothetical protein
MRLAIKYVDLHKIDLSRLQRAFGTKRVGIIEYNHDRAEELNEIVFEFSIDLEHDLVCYLKDCSVTGRVFK